MIEDTIVAITTPPGRGGVGIVRLSGPKSYSIVKKLSNQKEITPRNAYYCKFMGTKSDLIDQGILLYFKAPNSFTGEDVAELQVHGAPIVLDQLISTCVDLGARIANPGEFSQRAFLNEKMDLTQAEAIADLINASSVTATRLAMRSLQGDFSARINELNKQIIHLRMYVESAIDFPEEEIDFLNDGIVATMLNNILLILDNIRANASQGVMMREGLSVVIAGRPNAGKSTLINALAQRDVAIVTEIAGTTRDVMREHILIDDIPVHIVDTAGLRESDDIVEREGIKRAWAEVINADCVLLVVDINQDEKPAELSQKIQEKLPNNVPVLTVFNKIDTSKIIAKAENSTIYLSAKSGDGLSLLKNKIKELVGYQPAEGNFLARRRHLQALDAAKSLLESGSHQLQIHHAGELLAEDLRQAHLELCKITGEFSSDDLLGEIFSSFCIGK